MLPSNISPAGVGGVLVGQSGRLEQSHGDITHILVVVVFVVLVLL